MSNIIIFSKHDLIRFYFKKLITDIFDRSFGGHDVQVKICYTLFEFNTVISETDNAHIILDADNIDKSDMLDMILILNKGKKRFKLFLILKNRNSLNYFSELKKIPVVFICKSSAQALLEKILEDFISNQRINDDELKLNKKSKKLHKLTKREGQVIYYLLKGLSNGEIANILRINYKTVSSHRVSIYRKYNVNNSIGLYLHPELHRQLLHTSTQIE